MQTVKSHFSGAELLRRSTLAFLLLMLVVAAVMLLLYRAQMDAGRAVLRASERQMLDLARHSAVTKLDGVRSDLLYLAESMTVQRWLASSASVHRSQMEQEFAAFAAHKGLYEQIRLLDIQGREVVRVRWQAGRPQGVPQYVLQDKSDRYWVRASLALAKGEIYISPFDLNVEYGVIEQPPKPVIRFVTPVHDRQGRKHGMLVLNYRGQGLIDQIKAIAAQAGGQLWLLDAQGYWLLGPDAQSEWAFMYPDRADRRFDVVHSDAWTPIRHGSMQGQFMTDDGLYTYDRLAPPALVRVSSHNVPDWILVAYVGTAMLAANNKDIARHLGVTFGVLLLLAALISWVVAYQGLSRKQAEASMRANEARFRGLFESAPDAVIISDPDGKIVMVNAQAQELFGYQRQELIGKPIETLLPERFRARHVAHRSHYVAEPQPRIMGTALELYAQRKNGSEFPVGVSLSPVRTDTELLIFSDIRDMTLRKQTELELRSSEARFRSVAETANDAVITADSQGNIVYFNRAAEHIFGYAVTEAVTQPLTLLMPERFRHDHKQGMRRFLTTGTGRAVGKTVELIGQRKNGTEFPIELSLATWKIGDDIYFTGLVRDITQRRQAEGHIQRLNEDMRVRTVALEAVNKELEAFSYSVSHDLRAPLRAIDGFSQVLLEDHAVVLDIEGRGHLQRIRTAAQHMGVLIDDLIRLSRVTRSEILIQEVDMSELAADIARELRMREPQHRVELTIEAKLQVRGDARLLRIALENLLNNAWKFTRGRDPAHIAFGRTQHNGQPAYFVQDDGAGFDVAYADKLFGVFQRLHDAREFPGTGIGLATAQRVIHKHGGRIWAQSVPDKGATFYFMF